MTRILTRILNLVLQAYIKQIACYHPATVSHKKQRLTRMLTRISITHFDRYKTAANLQRTTKPYVKVLRWANHLPSLIPTLIFRFYLQTVCPANLPVLAYVLMAHSTTFQSAMQ